MSKRVGVQLAYPYTEKRMVKWFGEVPGVFVQPKLNGVRVRWQGNQLWTSEGNPQESVPHIEDQLWTHFKDVALDGELYRHGWRLQQIRSVTGRTVNLHEDYDKIKFHAFDLLDTGLIQQKRFAQMISTRFTEKFVLCDAIKRVPAAIVTSVELIRKATEAYVEGGYEGSIVRHPAAKYKPARSVYMVKWKPHHSDVYQLVEMLEGAGKYEGTLGALIVRDDDGREFHVGSFAVTDAERGRLWEQRRELEGKAKVRIRYTELTADGVPPSSVFRTIVSK